MKRTKMLLSMLLVFMLCIAMTACGKKEEPVEEEKPVQQEETAKEGTMVGTLADATMNTITVKNQAGNEFSFSTEGAEMDIANGLEIGNYVEVTYTGDLGDGSNVVTATKVVDSNDNTKAEQDKVEIKAETATMYATRGVHVRASYSTDSEILDSITKGAEVKVTGKSDNGWYRVDYKGQDAYIASAYLSDKKPADDTENKHPAKKPDQGAQTQEAIGKITYCDGATMKLKMDQKEYSFNILSAKVKLKKGLYEGEDVKIIYSGNLDKDPVLHEITDANL